MKHVAVSVTAPLTVVVADSRALILACCEALCDGLATPGSVSVLLSVAVSLADKEGDTCAALDDRDRLTDAF